ncbi:MAG: type I-MYXAN CRISPR-associated protein Cas6/Cmx6 [Thermodesulfobacteriota bacterium]
MKVDLQFKVFGKEIRVDHGYALFAAVSRILPEYHETSEAGLALIRGRYAGDGKLVLGSNACLTFRVPIEKLPPYLNLAGKVLDLDGQVVRLGVPSTRALIPATTLHAHLVTTRNGQEQDRFTAEIHRQLATLPCRGKLSVGQRRTFKVHGKQVVGYSVLASELTAVESIALQEQGLGGRRKLGCGFFEPWRGGDRLIMRPVGQ